jgi:hypothetical protein
MWLSRSFQFLDQTETKGIESIGEVIHIGCPDWGML